MARFHGIIPPLVTPLLDRDCLDTEGLEKLIEHVLAGGVNGVFILGSSGEAPSLSYRLRRELIERTCRQVDRRVPVLVGITDTAFVESVNLAGKAADAGADAVVLAPPYYFPAGQAELIEYLEDLVPRLPLPVMLYNMPSLTKVTYEIETLRRCAGLEKIVGIKDSGGELEYFRKLTGLKTLRPDWSVMIGPEHLLYASIEAGGDGGVSGGANYLPQLFVDCYAAAPSGDHKRVRELDGRIREIQKLYEVGRYGSRIIKGIKCALSLMGLCSDFMAEPFHKFRLPERRRVRAYLEEFRGFGYPIPLEEVDGGDGDETLGKE